MAIFKYLALVTEVRSKINQRHDLVDVLFLVLAGVSCGLNGLRSNCLASFVLIG